MFKRRYSRLTIIWHRCRYRWQHRTHPRLRILCYRLTLTDDRDLAYAKVYWKRRQRRALNTSLEEDVREWKRRLR